MTRLRRKSKKRAALDRKVKPFRARLIATVGQCELCNRDFSLSVHEISRGSTRSKSLMEPSCVLILCNAPHGIRPSCHSVVGAWDRAKQLALLLIRRGGDYDLNRYHEIIGRKKPSQAEVDGFVEEILRDGK